MESVKKEEPKVKKSRGSGSCCSVSSCRNTGKTKLSVRPEIKFHRFPKDPDLRREWIRKCGRKERFNPDTGTVCSDHFAPEDYQRDLRAELLGLGDDKKKLSADAVPCRNLPPDIQKKIRKRRDRDLTEGEKLAKRKKLVAEAIQWAESLPTEPPETPAKPKKILESTVLVSKEPVIKPSPDLKNALLRVRNNIQIDEGAIRVLQSPEQTPIEVRVSESVSSVPTQSVEMLGTEEASPENSIAIDFTTPVSSPVNLREENSTWDHSTYQKKYSDLISNYENLSTKYKRCYKVLCCFKLAYTKLRSQNNAAKNKIVELRLRNRVLQRQLNPKTEKKPQKQNKFIQTDNDPFEDDVSGWW